MQLQGKRLYFIGDSITEGACTDGEGYRYWELLAARTGAVCNADGRGGSCIARQQNIAGMEWNGNITHHFCSRLDDVDTQADVIVVFGGVNDFGHGDAPFGTMDDRTEDTFYGALHVLYSGLITRCPQARVVVMTPLHFTDEEQPIGGNGRVREGLLADYVRIIREVAEYYSLPVLDMYATSGLQPCVTAIRERYMPDGLHPNNEGHCRLADCVEAFLKAL